MNPGQLMKVTYHEDTKKINKYIKYTSVYGQMLERILENCPYKHDGGVRLFWIGKFIKYISFINVRKGRRNFH